MGCGGTLALGGKDVQLERERERFDSKKARVTEEIRYNGGPRTKASNARSFGLVAKPYEWYHFLSSISVIIMPTCSLTMRI